MALRLWSGDNWRLGFCQGSVLSAIRGRASQGSQVTDGMRSPQCSACAGVLKRGIVQYSDCLAKQYQ